MTQPAHHGKTGSQATFPLASLPLRTEETVPLAPPVAEETSVRSSSQMVPVAPVTTLTTNGAEPGTPTLSTIISAVRAGIGEQNYRHWFQERSQFRINGSQLIVQVANPFISGWILKRFRSELASVAAQLLGPSAGFTVDADDSLRAAEPQPSAKVKSTTVTPPSGQLSASTSTASPVPVVSRPTPRRRFRSFLSFVDGPCNELALMAAKQVCEAPGERFNPLYLHGPTGVGKSHLLEAIYSELRRTHQDRNVLFLTSESFTNYFTQALNGRSVPSFRQRFRSVDVLLIDNIEFLGNKRATQEEFLHTIDQLVDHGGQLVITADRHPRLLTKHREELTTRFVSGLVCKVDSPAECTRQKLVASLALPHQGKLTRDALDYVARQGGKNARELQGAINCLVGHASLRGGRLTARQAREALGELKAECRHLVRISDVERIVCEIFGVSVQDMRSKTRRKAIACPRSVAMFIARRLTKAAWREIGQYFGGRDHSTVVAAARRVEQWIENSEPVELPNSCRGTTWTDVVREIEEQILALAS